MSKSKYPSASDFLSFEFWASFGIWAWSFVIRLCRLPLYSLLTLPRFGLFPLAGEPFAQAGEDCLLKPLLPWIVVDPVLERVGQVLLLDEVLRVIVSIFIVLAVT